MFFRYPLESWRHIRPQSWISQQRKDPLRHALHIAWCNEMREVLTRQGFTKHIATRGKDR